jgi:F-type H+-transporting ATPase subunit b
MLSLAFSALSAGPQAKLVTPLLAGGGSGAIDLDLDWTFVAQIVLFTVLGFVLKPLLFDPVLKVFEERERRTEGAKAEAREMQERAGEILEKYEAELARVHAFVAEEREHMRTETSKLENRVIDEARESVNRVVEEGRQKLADHILTIRKDLADQALAVAKGVAGQALGREVTG